MLNTGTVLQNRYQIIQRIGGGGMGDVYLAADTRLGNNRVVVKENRGGDPQLFHTEANILAALHHPNLPRVIDHFIEPNNTQYLVMDYIAGQNLEQIIQARGMLNEQDALAWMFQVLDAARYLHANHIIHRDIKPQNIIITPDGRAMLVDFGIAKVMLTGQMTITGARGLGSPGYAPPEQYTGGTDERSDVYSLGATLYFALTGIEPPAAPNRAYGTPLAPIRQRNASATPEVEQVIFQAMSLAGDQRYANVATMEQTLRQPPVISRQLPITPRQPPAPYTPPTRLARPTLTGIIIVGGLASFAICALALFVFVPQFITSPTPTTLGSPPPVTRGATPGAGSVLLATPTPRTYTLAGTPVPTSNNAISPSNAGQIVQLARWGKGKLGSVTWSPDGKQIAVISSVGVYLFDAQTLQETLLIETPHQVLSVAFTSDGKILASVADDDKVQLWDLATGSELRAFTPAIMIPTPTVSPTSWPPPQPTRPPEPTAFPTAKVLSRQLTGEKHINAAQLAAFTPDDKMLATVSKDKVVLWNITSGYWIRNVADQTYQRIQNIAFTPDGKNLVSNYGIWDITTARAIEPLKFSESRRVVFSPDRKTIAIPTWRSVILKEIATGVTSRELVGHTGEALDVAFSLDGKTIASASKDKTARLWNAANGQEMRTLSGHTDSVFSLSFSPDSKTLATASEDGTIKFWDVASGAELRTLSGFSGLVLSVAVSSDGKILASGTSDQTVRLMDAFDGSETQKLIGHKSAILNVAFAPDGKTLASSSTDARVLLWDLATRKILQDYQGTVFAWGLRGFVGSSRTSVAIVRDTSAEGWDSGRISIVSHPDPNWTTPEAALKLIPSRNPIYTYLYDLDSGWQSSRRVLISSDSREPVWAVIFAPDGKTLASTFGNRVKVWEVETGRELRTLTGHTDRVWSLAFSPDGKILASASSDNTVRLWDPSTGGELRTLTGHTDVVGSVVFSPDGKLIVSGSNDGTIRLWGVR